MPNIKEEKYFKNFQKYLKEQTRSGKKSCKCTSSRKAITENKKDQKVGVDGTVVEIEANQISYNSYNTKNFDICSRARNLFKNLQDLKGDELAEATRAAKELDKFLGYVKKYDQAERVTPYQIDKVIKCGLKVRGMLARVEVRVGRELDGRLTFIGDHITNMLDKVNK